MIGEPIEKYPKKGSEIPEKEEHYFKVSWTEHRGFSRPSYYDIIKTTKSATEIESDYRSYDDVKVKPVTSEDYYNYITRS